MRRKTRGRLMVGLVSAAVVGTLSAAGPAGAVVLFHDEFNRANNNTVGNGWDETNVGAGDVAIASNNLRLRDGDTAHNNGNVDAAAAQLVLSTLGYQNITLTFTWADILNGQGVATSDANDLLFAEWRIGTGAWTTTAATNLASLALGGPGTFASSGTLSLDSTANNQANIQFRFRTDVNGDNEGALVDDVVLSGTAVPEPTSLALLSTGLLGLGAMFRRRRKT